MYRRRDGTAGPICAVTGSGGIGTTAIAVWWIRQAAARFPAGQLFVDLQGPRSPVPRCPVPTRSAVSCGRSATLGMALEALGDHREAVACWEEALGLLRQIGSRDADFPAAALARTAR